MGAYSTDVLLDKLIEAITAAWNVPKIIEDTEPPTYDGVASLPYVVLCPGDLTASLSDKGSSVSVQYEHNPFKITLRSVLPDPAMKVTRFKTQAAQQFRDQVQMSAEFAEVGLFPLITKIGFARLGDPTENACELVIHFECWTQSTHH